MRKALEEFTNWFLVVLMLCATMSCCTVNIRSSKLLPEYTGVDPALQPLVDQYMDYAKEAGIKFDKKVTMGFKDINHGDVIGECHYGSFFREIDIDKSWWAQASGTSRLALVFHESSHCYCDRGHDYGDGKLYTLPESIFAQHKSFDNGPSNFGGRTEGRYKDGCPLSIMYPQILEDECTYRHFNEYVSEMFNRCKPY